VYYNVSELMWFRHFLGGADYLFSHIAGSRAGAIIAACWATMMFIGHEGYVDATLRIVETTRHIEAKYTPHYLQPFHFN